MSYLSQEHRQGGEVEGEKCLAAEDPRNSGAKKRLKVTSVTIPALAVSIRTIFWCGNKFWRYLLFHFTWGQKGGVLKKDVRNLRRVCDDFYWFLRVMQDVSGGKTCLYFKREIFRCKIWCERKWWLRMITDDARSDPSQIKVRRPSHYLSRLKGFQIIRSPKTSLAERHLESQKTSKSSRCLLPVLSF